MTSYRIDNRTIDDFKESIKLASIKEAEIAIRIGIDKYERTKKWPYIISTGCGPDGEYLQNKQVNTYPDFVIDGVPTEITRSGPSCRYCFHEKVSKVVGCIKNKHNLVFVNGINDPEPLYINLSAIELEVFTNKALDFGEKAYKFMGSFKPVYKYKIDWFGNMWKSLPKINNVAKNKYSHILCQDK